MIPSVKNEWLTDRSPLYLVGIAFKTPTYGRGLSKIRDGNKLCVLKSTCWIHLTRTIRFM